MSATGDGVTLDLALEDGTKLPHGLADVRPQPLGGRRAVPRLRAARRQGPLRRGRRPSRRAPRTRCRSTRATCWSSSTSSSSSVDKENLQVVVARARHDVRRHRRAAPAAARQRQHVRRRGVRAHRRDASRCSTTGSTVLRTQQGERREHPVVLARPGQAHRRARATATATSAPGPRRARPAAARELDALLEDLEPTLPVLLGNAVSVNQVVVDAPRRPRAAARDLPARSSPAASPAPPATATATSTCSSTTASRRAPRATSRAASGGRPSDLSDGPIYPAQCTSGPPYVQRGTKYSPGRPTGNPGGRPTAGPTTRATGLVDGAVDANGNPVRFVDQGNLSILGDDAWKWLLVGPVGGDSVRHGVACNLAPATSCAAGRLRRCSSSRRSRVLDDDAGRPRAGEGRGRARRGASGEQERYGDVLAAAPTEAEAFVNIDYDDAQAQHRRGGGGRDR